MHNKSNQRLWTQNMNVQPQRINFFFEDSEAVAQRCSVKKLFLETSQNSQENICARVSFVPEPLRV